MRKMTVNILCSTALTLLVLAAFGTMFGATVLFINGVFQSLIANIVIHIGLLLTHKFESKYAILEYTLDIVYTIAVVLIFGFVFNWYSSTPAWMLVSMSVLIYFTGMLLSTIQMRQDISEINKLLKKRNNTKPSMEMKK